MLCFYVTGGRGKEGAPIITFPEYSGFSEVPEDDFLNVVTYLTSIPRYAHSFTVKTIFLYSSHRNVIFIKGLTLGLSWRIFKRRLHSTPQWKILCVSSTWSSRPSNIKHSYSTGQTVIDYNGWTWQLAQDAQDFKSIYTDGFMTSH